jgi:hypothetical protein
MKNTRYPLSRFTLVVGMLLCAMAFSPKAQAQTETVDAGSFVIDMGITPQTVANGLKPYGMIYDLITNYGVPIKWVIDPGKVKDGIDFSHGGFDYRGGPFIIPAIHRTAAVNTRITHWQGQGVVGRTLTTPVEVPVFKTLVVSSAPNWTLDYQNGSIAAGYFVNAGIPASAHGGAAQSGWKLPAALNNCDDIFVMPHADPTWAVHRNLVNWNRDHKGSIWTACHSGSALELMFDNTTADGDPVDFTEQANFLTNKYQNAAGGGPYSNPNNTLIHWQSHSNGTPPYTYFDFADPVMQFMGTIDAAVLNGSEQIYIPVQQPGGGWRPSTVVGVYDPDHPQATLAADPKYRAAVIAYGYGFGDTTRGRVMYEAGHSHNKALLPANIAAQRAFFNFSFIAAKQKDPDPEVTIDLSAIYGGTVNDVYFITQGREIEDFVSITWESSCGGSFGSNVINNALDSVYNTFTAPAVSANTNCVITITLVDGCGKQYKSSTGFVVQCELAVQTTLVNPCFGDPTSGSITMSITQGDGPYVWDWVRTQGGSGSGSGVSISGLQGGDYTVTVTSNNGLGCPKVFTVTLVANPEIVAIPDYSSPDCFGGTNGSIDLSVSGGTPGYTYLWSDGSTLTNRSSLPAGNYSVTITDSRGCTVTEAFSLTEPDEIVPTPVVTNVTCFGFSNGQISLNVTGGDGNYTYLWNNGSSNPTRTNLGPGSYSVTVTDGNGCTGIASGISITQPAAALSASSTKTDVACYGFSTGAIDVTVTGGTTPYTYIWTNGATTEDLSGLAAGGYGLTVTDASGCFVLVNRVINQNSPLVVVGTRTNVTCLGDNDGEIDLSVSGGVLGYTYAWTGPGGFNSTLQNITGLEPGNYSVTVTDSLGCTAIANVTIEIDNPEPVAPTSINN